MKQVFRFLNQIRFLMFPAIVLAVLLFIIPSISNLKAAYSDEACTQLEIAIRRGVAACYAAEGVYPDSLDYLKEHYGITVDESKYVVYYDIFAENLMPMITVDFVEDKRSNFWSDRMNF